MTPLKDKLRTAAAAYGPLTAIIGSNPIRYWNVQARQGATFPYVVATLVSDAPTYAFQGPLTASFARMQFVLWDTDPQRLEDLDAAMQGFIAQFNGAGLPDATAQGNYILNRRDAMFAQTQPPQYQRLLDVRLYSGEQA